MPIVTAIAVYFILWWVVLFTMLPFGLKTQREADDVTLGTVESAPAGPHMGRVVLRTTILTTLIFALFWYLTHYAGFSLRDLPSIIPAGK